MSFFFPGYNLELLYISLSQKLILKYIETSGFNVTKCESIVWIRLQHECEENVKQ